MVRLSPSKVKTVQSCSLKFWYNYKAHQYGDEQNRCGLPTYSNSGALRGDCTHRVLECLSNTKRRERVEKMIQFKDPWIDEPTKRLAQLIANKNRVGDEENFEMIRQFILAAIQEDFYCDGADSVEIEKNFVIEGDGFILNGFIDKSAIWGDKVKIIDYKTSKKKFTKDELSFNLQNYFYTFAEQKPFSSAASVISSKSFQLSFILL